MSFSLVYLAFTIIEINALLKKMKFTEEKGQGLSITDKEDLIHTGLEAWVVGTLVSESCFNKEAFFRVFQNVWYTTTKVQFSSLPSTSVLIKFGSIEDRRKIFDQVGRASINLYFAMAECIDGCPHANYDLSKVFFWAVLNVPLTWMNRA